MTEKQNKRKAFIFDLDGVIVFTDHFHYLAWKKIADEMGIFFDEKTNDRLRGVSRAESLDIILEQYDGSVTDEEKRVLMEEKNEVYRALLTQMTHEDVPEEVRETLKKLKENGYLLAVGSSSKNARFILDKVGLSHEFHVVADGTDITHSKPHPEVFQKAAEYLGVNPGNCIVVEDAEAGIEAAKAAGMTAVGIGKAAQSGKADFQISGVGELLKIAGRNIQQEV